MLLNPVLNVGNIYERESIELIVKKGLFVPACHQSGGFID
tara:strand:- start:3046 stop:3165 length:120 start_codon:yes stop_codon:yes gene_type:complete